MSSNPDFDRWYAAKSARFLVEPSHRLATFGNTLVNYHLVSELDDHPGKVRIREGRLEAHQPLVITPHFQETEFEGLGDEAREYFNFLKENEERLRVLRYGYHLKSDNFSEQIVTDRKRRRQIHDRRRFADTTLLIRNRNDLRLLIHTTPSQ